MPTVKKSKGPKHHGTHLRDAIVYPLPPEAYGLTERQVFEAWITGEGQRIYEAEQVRAPGEPVWAAIVFPMPPWWDEQQHGRHRHLDYCSTCRPDKPCQVQ